MTVVTIAIAQDETGKWIAFGQSDNSTDESVAVVGLLSRNLSGAKTFRSVTMTFQTEEPADV